MSTYIEVQEYGDFDIKQTVCIMVHPVKMNEKELMEEFYQSHGIESNSGLSYKELQTVTDELMLFLKGQGFKKLKTFEISFSD